jgi:hypothetical protein
LPYVTVVTDNPKIDEQDNRMNERGSVTNMSIATFDESSILSRVIAPDKPTLPPDVATELLKWGFSEADKQRMSELAAKARQGILTPNEKSETEEYERVSSFLGLVKSKARRSLRMPPGDS